jgi:hypothetical protein
MRRTIALAESVLAGSFAPAAAAQTPTLAPLKPCYVTAGDAPGQQELVTINAQNLTKNGTASVAIDGAVIQDNAAIDPMGALLGTVPAPFQRRGQRPFTLSVTDKTNPAVVLTAQSLVTALDVRVSPVDARPSLRVRFHGRGFTGADPAVYAHYLRKGKLRKTVQLATAAGPCGTFDVRRRQLPIRRPATGRWMVQIDQERAWHKTPASVSVQLSIDVMRSPGIGTRTSVPS